MNISRSLATFASKEEMDETIRKHLYYNAHALTETAKRLLLKLSQLSINIPGVSWAYRKTLAADLGVSIATIKRALSLLVELGLIRRPDRTEQRRKENGKFCGNIYVIEPIAEDKPLPSSNHDEPRNEPRQMTHGDDSKTPVTPSVEGIKKDAELRFSLTKISKEKLEKENVKDVSSPSLEIDPEIPNWFTRLVRPLSVDPLLIADLWESLLFALKKTKRVAIGALQLRNAVKSLRNKMRDKSANEPGRYFYGALLNQLSQSDRAQHIDWKESSVLVDELPASVKWQMEQSGQSSKENTAVNPVDLLKEDKAPASFSKAICNAKGQGIDAFPELAERLKSLRARASV